MWPRWGAAHAHWEIRQKVRKAFFSRCAHKQLNRTYQPLHIRICMQIWTASSEIVPSSMRKFRSSCACAKYHPCLSSQFVHSVVSNDTVSGQHMPWSDCANAQADLDFRCPHMPEDSFSHGASHMIHVIKKMCLDPQRVLSRPAWTSRSLILVFAIHATLC